MAHIETNAPLISLPPFQRCGPHQISVAHIQYAPLIYGLSVAHIEYAPLINLTKVGPVGARWGPQNISGAYLSKCAIDNPHINGAYRICAIGKPWWLVRDPPGGTHQNISGALFYICAIDKINTNGAYFSMRHW